ncbi:MAG TPA: transposase [Actinomycetes bacterium]|nr:transposase [Actinomycetes bacterium]
MRGVFLANAAWALVATLAHHLLRWVDALGLGVHGLVVAKTIRRRFITLPGRLTHTARRRHLHLPSGWPWAEGFLAALARLRALPLRT